ncbi:hypothetical protein TSAR_005781 [Trichomalopsis sarcophagae]|uniref:Uncharacterized protein n=1 Tax=Trichomalopsis sarcophagae TaxID=543379 RepID=A0A232EMA1_9HYME|nr:hypothetical protein TSAR_005781 [Trichomalopsis sarcophagae]
MAAFSYNTSVHEATQHTPYESVFGRLASSPSNDPFETEDRLPTYADYIIELTTRLNNIQEIAREKLIAAKWRANYYYDRSANPQEFKEHLHNKYLLMYAGHELLKRAIKCENLDNLSLLLEASVNDNAKNTFGSTALMYAVDRGDMPVIRLLLEAGADPNRINHFDQTPLERATRTKPEILE